MAYTAIDDPEAYFQVKLWTGTGSSNALTLDGSEDMQPDLVWIKARSEARNHKMFDSVRGVTKVIGSNETEYETTVATSLTAFGSDGFTVSSDVSVNENTETFAVNENTETFVAWCWKESATAGFDIVSYTGNGTDDTDISHNLSAVPKMIIVKNRDASDAWQVYHGANTSAPETDYLVLNTDAATVDAADRWSDEAPTSSVFTLGDTDEVNTNTENYIAYCFAEKQGFSKFGKYTGNGNADGTFIYTGFRPAFVIFKRSDSGTENWAIIDSTRSYHNVGNHTLATNSQNAESSFGGGESVGGASNKVDLVSNGIKIREASDYNNTSSGTYIYMAFAEQPFVNSNGVPCNAR